MTDSAATCILCDRDRIPERGLVDNACRAGLPRLCADIRIMGAQLAEPDDLVPDRRLITKALPRMARGARPPGLQLRPGRTWEDLDKRPRPRYGEPRDPVAATLPSGARGLRAGDAPVSGTRHPPLPISPDRVDLTLWARAGSRALFARGALGTDPDQVGHMGIRTAVDTWVRDWAARRRESLPPAHLPAMLRWMAARTDWACDHYPDVAAWAAEMRQYRATMRHLLGQVEVPEHMVGVSCPSCRARSLYRENGELWIQCAECPRILSPAEYLKRVRDNVTCLRCTGWMEAWAETKRQVAWTAARAHWRWREPYSCYRRVGFGANWDNEDHYLTR